MYTLILVIGLVVGGGVPVGVTSHAVGKFQSLDDCKKAAEQPMATGVISELNLSKGIYWYCVYNGGS